MAQIGKIKQDRVSIKGYVNASTPVAKDGETHVSFEGAVRVHRSVSNMRVALIRRDGTSTFYWADWLQANAGSFAVIGDPATIDVNDFDLLLWDFAVWSLTTGNKDQLIAFADQGLSSIVTGNDASWTQFSSGRTGASGAHTIIYDKNLPPEIDTSYTTGDTDLIGGMDTITVDVDPVSYRSDTGQCTGFIYTSPVSGAKMFFSQQHYGDSGYLFLKTMAEYLSRYSTSGIVDNNTVLTDRGLNLTPGTTNHEINTDFRPYQSLSHCSGFNVTGQFGVPPPPFEGGTVWKIEGNASNGFARLAMESRVPDVNWEGYDKTYVWSVWVWYPSSVQEWDGSTENSVAQNDTNVDWHLGDNDYTASKQWYSRNIEDGDRKLDFSIRDRWQRIWIRFTPTTANINVSGNNDVIYASGYMQLDLPDHNVNNGVNYCYVACAQVENKDFPTAWTSSSRPSTGSTWTMPVIATADFTFGIEIEFDCAYHEHAGTGNYGDTLLRFTDEDTGLYIEYKDYNNVTRPAIDSRPYINLEPDATWAVTATIRHLHHTVAWTKEEPYCIFLTKVGETITIEWYRKRDRALIKSQTFTYTGTDNLFSTFKPTLFRMGSTDNNDVWAGTVTRFSFFNGDAGAAAKQTWIGKNFKASIEGDLSVDDIEESVYVPEDCVHFPLDFDTFDKSKTVQAEIKDNLYFEDKGIRVSTSTSNHLASGEAWWTGANTSYINDAGWHKVTSINVSTSNWFRPRADLAQLVDATTYSCRAEVYNPNDTPIEVLCTWCQTGNFIYTIPPNETVIVTASGARSTYDTTFRFFEINLRNNPGEYWVKNVQINTGAYIAAYGAALASNNSKLGYNLYRDLNVDWSTSWTVCVFYKPVGTHTFGDKTGYCIPIALGGNLSGSAKYWWFGKNSGANAVRNVTGTFQPADFFDHWQMIAITHDGSGLLSHRYFGLNIGGVTEHTGVQLSNFTDDPDQYITSYGIDVHLGSWDGNSSCSNCVVRDMIIHPKAALSDAEVDKIWKSWVNVNIDRTRVSGEVYEGNI